VNSIKVLCVILQMSVNMYPHECIICYEEIATGYKRVLTSCGHKYCSDCFRKHMKIENRCAVCRQEIVIPTFVEVYFRKVRGVLFECVS
jgi:hypothetical protein